MERYAVIVESARLMEQELQTFYPTFQLTIISVSTDEDVIQKAKLFIQEYNKIQKDPLDKVKLYGVERVDS